MMVKNNKGIFLYMLLTFHSFFPLDEKFFYFELNNYLLHVRLKNAQ